MVNNKRKNGDLEKEHIMARIPRLVIAGEQAVYHAWGFESSISV
jgi:hypothetical protein